MNKKLPVVFGLLLITFNVYCQQKTYHLDTLIVEIDAQIKVKIASYSMVWLNHYEGFSSRVEQFQKDLSKIRNEIPRDKNILIISEKIGEITLKITGDRKEFIIENAVESFRINRAVIRAEKYEIFIEFQEIDKLLSTDIQKPINNATTAHEKGAQECHGPLEFTAEAEKKGRGTAFNVYAKCENDTVIFDPDRTHFNQMKDQLFIDPNVGFGIAQNKLTTDFGLRIGIAWTDMGVLRKHYYISYNLVYDFNQEQTFNLNHFVNLGYRKNFASSRSNYKWRGAEIGYLIHFNGEFFSSPTIKLGTMIEFTDHINITPEIYFDDGFKKVYPGIRLGIDLFD
jgi:hypothetical protein